jgi:molecular chaperone HtpG
MRPASPAILAPAASTAAVPTFLELNAEHPVVEAMRLLLNGKDSAERLREYVEMLYDQALLTARLPLEDPIRFAQRVSTLMATQAAGPTDPKVP